jgi:diguanylate cyclase
VTAATSDHEHTMALANIALGQIRALRLSADPRNYEFFFHYATGRNAAFNKAVNDCLATKKTLSDADIQELHRTFLSGLPTEKVESLGAKVVGEIDQVMAMIDAAVGSTTSYSATLADAKQQIGHAADREALRVIVESLVSTTKEAERANHALEARLQASRQEIRQLHEHLETARTESLTDPLTTLANRKSFDQALTRMMVQATSKGEPLSLMMLDIAARYGGEEFAVVLPNTALRQALTVGEHIRRAVMMKELMKRSTGETLGRVSISAGIALQRNGESAQSLIERADACLYAAKRTGRNKVVCESDPEFMTAANAQVA